MTKGMLLTSSPFKAFDEALPLTRLPRATCESKAKAMRAETWFVARRLSSSRQARSSPMLTWTAFLWGFLRCSTYSTLLASCSQKGWTSNTSPPGSSSSGLRRLFNRSHALEGGKSLVQKLFERLKRCASFAIATGMEPATAAMPQSEASVALKVPRVLALKFTTARVLKVSMVNNSFRKPAERRTTCLSFPEALIASKIWFMTARSLRLIVKMEMYEPAIATEAGQ